MKVSSVQIMEAVMRLEGKVAFISGGARGMGAVEAKLFAREGARVAIGDVLEQEGYQVVEEISESGGEALFVHLDVTDERQWQTAISTTVQRFGKLDILVNNAGIGGHSLVEHTTIEEWDRVMDINAKGVFLGTKTAIPEMRRAGGDSIINISSQLGLVGVDNSSP
jgi:NAD(P)-dependent dehydrogenase (short-subunit alcohol dehydrogenase family)